MDRETTSWAASITKSVFATYVMQLVERGEFNLDQPVASQLASRSTSMSRTRDTASEMVKDPAWPTVTPRMLFHTSGLANFATIEPDKKMHLHFKPGTQFQYSGEGINLVQFVIEQQKQKPLKELMQDAFLRPLGMTRTGIIYREEFEADVADRYDLNEVSVRKRSGFPHAGRVDDHQREDLARFAPPSLRTRS